MTTLPRAAYLATLESFRGSSGLVVRDDRGAVLMLRTTYRETLDIPGGGIEPGESPAAAAEREAQEEIGLTLAAGRLLCVGHDAATERNPSAMLRFVFDGGRLPPEVADGIRPAEGEVAACVWVVPDEVARHASPRVGRRLALALRALDEGTTYYSDEGSTR